MPKIGVVFSGCGVYDGAEIQESVITLLSLDKNGADVVMMAPNVEQMHVINHLKGEPVEGETRNVLVESARIARGNITDIANVKGDDLDGLIFPGGFGGAKNLSDFAVKGKDATVNADVVRLVNEFKSAGKPIGFICIMPAVASKIFADADIKGVSLTVGAESETSAAMVALGAKHVVCEPTEIVIDEVNKIVSTPAYMCDATIIQVAAGIDKLVDQVVEMAG